MSQETNSMRLVSARSVPAVRGRIIVVPTLDPGHVFRAERQIAALVVLIRTAGTEATA